MGTATLDLDKWISQQKRTGEKVWLPLEGEGASGDVCVVVCWRYSEARAFSPFEDEPRVAAWQATLSLNLCDGVVVTPMVDSTQAPGREGTQRAADRIVPGDGTGGQG